ncbi:hypothetical protein CALCODRAFT_507386 [Calocera cornea HHB12733]|uniref:Uncharacterized protein n=1 Tax=Calocera cornea HHB12733 TaxID=1353952 RepID=A0A165HS96_9BASI|nr:hypothetical protein CALCODRAFT_507386 [Calocera cornea HHB12733]
MVPDVRSRHSLDSKRDASSFYAAGRAESFMTRRNSEGQATKQVPDIVVTQNGHLSPGIHGNGLLPAGSHSPRSGRSGGVTPQTVLSQTTTDRKSKGKSIEIEEVPDVDSNANGWGGGFVGEPAEDSNDLKDKQKEKSKGKEKARKNGRDKHKNAQGDLPGIHQTMDNPAGKEGKEGGASTGDNGWGWGGAGSGDAANGDTGGGWGGTGEAIGGVGGGGWGNTAEPDPAGASHSNGNGWGVSEDSPGAEPSKWDTGTAVTIHHVETDVKSVKSAMSSDTSKTTAAASKALVPPKPADGPLVPVGNQQVGPKREKSKSKSGKENRKTPNGAEPPNPPNPNNWTGPSAQSWNAATGPYQGGKGTVIATRYNPSGSQSSKSPYWQPSEAVRDMDPRKGIQDVGGIVQGVYVPATRHLPAVIEVNPMPVGSKKPSGAGGLFGPNLPTPEIAEKMRKEAEEKALAEKKKMDEALMHAKWAEAVREGVKADMERQIFLQQNGINLEDYFRRHPERTWTGQVQEPRWPAQQAPVQPKGKGKKKQDQYPDYGVQYQDPAYAGYSYDPGQTGPMEYANNNWGQTEGYGYPGEYAQDHVPHQKGKKKKGGQARQDQQQGWPLDGNAYGDAGGGQQPWYADQPNANVWAQPGPTEQHKGSKNPGKKSKPGKNKRNFRDEEVDPYVLNGQGGWNAAAADPHQNPAGHGHQENGWGGGGAHGETGQTNWGQAAGGSTRGDGNAWGSGRHGNEPAQAWADEGRANADKGKKKSGGFMSKVKALFGGGKKKDEGWGWGDNNSGWPTANTQNGPAVNVQTEMTYAQQPQNMDWGGWPVADTGGAGGGGGGWDQQAAEHQANGHGHQHTKPGPAAHTNGYSGPAKGYGAPSVHHAQNGGWSGAQPAASVHHGQGGWGQGASSVHQGQGGGWGDQAAGSAHRGQGGWGGTQAAASVHHGQGGWGGAQPAGPAAPAWPQPGGHGTAEDQKWAAAAVYQHPAAAAMQAHGQAPAPEDQKWGAAAYQHPAAATMQAHGHAAPPQGHVREPAGYYNQGFPENALVDSDEESDDGPMGLAALESLGGMGGMGAENQMASLLEKLNHVQQERAGGVGGGGGGGKALRRKATGRPRH